MFNSPIIVGNDRQDIDCTNCPDVEMTAATSGYLRRGARVARPRASEAVNGAPHETRIGAPGEYDFWLANGSRGFGRMPLALPEIPNVNLPICLQMGNQTWGVRHMEQRHGRWLAAHNVGPAALLWKKCRDWVSSMPRRSASNSKSSFGATQRACW